MSREILEAINLLKAELLVWEERLAGVDSDSILHQEHARLCEELQALREDYALHTVRALSQC